MKDEQQFGAIFPLAGVDASCEYGRQPQDTTPDGHNVRAFEVITDRGRGGSRCGLTKYVNERVNGLHEVQHLTVLIDPQEPALNGPADTVDVSGIGSYVLDPSTNNTFVRNFGRFVRKRGSGRVPFRVKQGHEHPGDGTFTGNLNPHTLGDGDIFMTFATTDTGNGNYNGEAFEVEGIITPPPSGINQDVPFSVWVVGSGPFDGLVQNLGDTFPVTVTVESIANGINAFYQEVTIVGIPP